MRHAEAIATLRNALAANGAMMELTAEHVARAMRDFYKRCEIGRRIGIPLEAVVDGRVMVPDGWVLDTETDYYLPSNVELF